MRRANEPRAAAPCDDALEIITHDDLEPCPYLPGAIARLPLRLPIHGLTPSQLDARLDQGARRCGKWIYIPDCPACSACEALRIDVANFTPSRTQKRTLRRGDRTLTTEIGEAIADEQRVRLYNLHRRGRNLARRESNLSLLEYKSFLVSTCCDTIEFRYRLDGELIGVAVADVGAESMSAVYYYFDPQYSRLSPGVYSVLKQIEHCREQNLGRLYLGFYVGESAHMSYKNQYLPHERRINGQWRRFERTQAPV